MFLRNTAVPSHKWILLACQVVTTQVSGLRALHLHRKKCFVNRLSEDSTVNLGELCKPSDDETTLDLSMDSSPVDLWQKLRNQSLSACLLISVCVCVHEIIHVAYRNYIECYFLSWCQMPHELFMTRENYSFTLLMKRSLTHFRPISCQTMRKILSKVERQRENFSDRNLFLSTEQEEIKHKRKNLIQIDWHLY